MPRPHYKAGAVLCTLEVKDKFLLFLRNGVDPGSFLIAGFNAGLNQAQYNDPSFGQGAAGYGKRFGANFADLASGSLFGDFVYPTIFAEDPRYWRLAHGSGQRRVLHALGHVFVANWENGTHGKCFAMVRGGHRGRAARKKPMPLTTYLKVTPQPSGDGPTKRLVEQGIDSISLNPIRRLRRGCASPLLKSLHSSCRIMPPVR